MNPQSERSASDSTSDTASNSPSNSTITNSNLSISNSTNDTEKNESNFVADSLWQSILNSNRNPIKMNGSNEDRTANATGTGHKEAQVLFHIFQSCCHPCPTLEMIHFLWRQEYNDSSCSSRNIQHLSLDDGNNNNTNGLALEFPRDVVMAIGGRCTQCYDDDSNNDDAPLNQNNTSSRLTSRSCSWVHSILMDSNSTFLKMSPTFQITFLKILMALLENKHPWDTCYATTNIIRPASAATNTDTTPITKSSNTTNYTADPSPHKRHSSPMPSDEITQRTLYSVIRFQCANHNCPHNIFRNSWDLVDAIWNMIMMTLMQSTLDHGKVSNVKIILKLQCRLWGILSSAGMTPQQLQRIFDWITSSSTTTSTSTSSRMSATVSVSTPTNKEKSLYTFQILTQQVKLHLLQAIIRAAGVSSFTMKLKGKASPRDLFCFGSFSGSSSSLSSSITKCNGITHTIDIDPRVYPPTSKLHQGWPWTHSFGMACWFRWEGTGMTHIVYNVANDITTGTIPHFYSTTLHADTPMTILKIQSKDGTCFEISLKPLDDRVPSVANIVYTVHDSLFTHKMKSTSSIRFTPSMSSTSGSSIRKYELKSCPILPNAWFHLAIRHVKKSYLSLQKDELTIMIDGKVMAREALKFPSHTNNTSATFSNDPVTSNGLLSFKEGIFSTASIAAKQHISSSNPISIEFCKGLNAETGSLYVFHGAVSDITFKALCEYTSGTRDSNHAYESSIHSSLHSAHIMKDADRNEIVVSRPRTSSGSNVGSKYKFTSEATAVDLIGDDDYPSDIHHPVKGEFSRSAFVSHLLFVWDASRLSEDGYILEAHSKIHCRLDHTDTSIWHMKYLNDTIRSIGGVQLLLCVIKSMILPTDVVTLSNGYEDELSSGKVLPLCISLVTSFLRDSDTNRREFLRCGGPEILENFIYENKKIHMQNISKRKVTNNWISTNSFRWNHLAAEALTKALMDLDHACSHDSVMRSKISSRIIFNVYLWFGGLGNTPGIALHAILLPCLSSAVKSDPISFSESVNISYIVNFIQELSIISSQPDVPNHFHFDDLSRKTTLSLTERNHLVDVSLGILYSLLSVRVTKIQLLPILQYISFNLEVDGETTLSSSTNSDEKHSLKGHSDQILLATQKICAMLALLLRTRPVISGMFDTINEILGEDASWFLCCLINGYDDELRSYGIHCFSALYDFLFVENRGIVEQSSLTKQILEVKQKAVTTFKNVGTGWSSTPRGFDISEKSLDIGYKLLWYILKGHRHHLTPFSHNAMMHALLRNPNETVTSYLDSVLIEDQILGKGFLFDHVRISTLYRNIQIDSNWTFRNTFATNAILDFSLRYLSRDEQEKWLFDLLTLIRVNPPCKKQFESTSEWHHSLFYVASDIVEELCAYNMSKLDNGIESDLLCMKDDCVERTIFSRFDLVFQLYATLISHCLRNDDLSISNIDLAAALQRVAVNGSVVFSILLSYILADLIQNGTLCISRDGQLRERNIQISAEEFFQLDVTRAARHWKTIRHIVTIALGLVTSNGFSLSELFDYKNNLSGIVDQPSGGLFGIHLNDDKVAGISAAQIIGLSRSTQKKDGSNPAYHPERDMKRRVSTLIASQVMELLDPFIFPSYSDKKEGLDSNHYAWTTLMRSLDSRLPNSKETLLHSLIRLALVNIAYLEPGSSKFLKACHMIRCYHQLSLELNFENEVTGDDKAHPTLIPVADRLAVCILMLCHKALYKCFTVLKELDGNEEKWSTFEPSKQIRRLFKCVEIIGDTIQDIYGSRYSLLGIALSKESKLLLGKCVECWIESKQSSQETRSNIILGTEWVQKFHDIDYVKSNEGDIFLVIPEHLKVTVDHAKGRFEQDYGFMIMKQVLDESLFISKEFISVLNEPFQNYLSFRAKWTNSTAIRDLEYAGNLLTTSLSRQYQDGLKEFSVSDLQHSSFAERRFMYIEKKMEKVNPLHWKLARNPDMMHRRILFVQNKNFDSHISARYDLGIGPMKEIKCDQDLQKLIQSAKAGIVKFSDYTQSDPQDKLEDEATYDDANSDQSIDEDKEHDRFITDWEKIDSSDAIPDKRHTKGSHEWVYDFIWAPKEKFLSFFENIQIVTVDALVEGELVLSTHNIYFKPTEEPISAITKDKLDVIAFEGIIDDGRWRLNRLSQIHGRRFMLRAQAIELFFADTHELFINFCRGPKERTKFVDRLSRCKTPLLSTIPKSLNPHIMFKSFFASTTDAWKERKISNFEYLMQLNIIAGRSFNDVSQYPIFPWVIADYESDELDLKNPSIYRDLSKPIGALNPDRLVQLIERYHDLDGLPEEEKFLYGSHYSSPGVVLHYLLRQEPFTSMAIALQSGRFDCPDRLFYNIAACWKSCLTSTSDVKELVPEFFTCPEIFLNTNNFPLGYTQSHVSISNVILPPWAKGSAYEFVRLNRLALESEYVSSNLHHWIDLIFGFKQRGPESIKANNVFHFLSYEGSVNLDKITNDLDRAATESQIQNFGQTPSQLIPFDPHPRRKPAIQCWKPVINEVLAVKRLTCYTPVKQFGGSKSKGVHGPVISIQVLSDHIVAIYADWRVGIYKWSPTTHGKTPFYLRMDKMRPIVTREMSTSSFAMGLSHERTSNTSSNKQKAYIGDWSFAMSTNIISQTSKVSRSLGAKTIASSLEATLISCGYCDGTLKAHTLDGLRLKCSEDGGHLGQINCICIGEDGILLVSGGEDCTCRIWTVEDSNLGSALIDSYTLTAQGYTQSALTCCLVLWGHVRPIISVACSVALDIVVSGSDDGRICIHTIRRGKFIRYVLPDVPTNPSCAIRHLALHPDGKFVANLDSGWLHMYTINGVNLSSVDAGEILNSIKMVPGGDSLVTGGEKGTVKIRSLVDLSIQYVLDLSDYGTIQSLAFTPQPPTDNKSIIQFIFVGTSDGSITVVCAEPDDETNHDNLDSEILIGKNGTIMRDSQEGVNDSSNTEDMNESSQRWWSSFKRTP